MAPGELVQKFLGRLSEARFCMEQGLADGTADIVRGILAEIEVDNLPQTIKDQIRSRALSILNGVNEHSHAQPAQEEEFQATEPAQFYSYGLALMDGQFWEEAIQELSMAAGLGFQRLKCWEYCGDCAAHLGKWEEAFRFYEYVYTDESHTDEQKKAVLTKISKCSQAQRKEHAQTKALANGSVMEAPEDPQTQCEFVNPSIITIDSYSVDTLIGQTATSWTDREGNTLAGYACSYRITDLLHVGSSSLIVELEEQNSGEKFAGQTLSGKLRNALPAKDWQHGQADRCGSIPGIWSGFTISQASTKTFS